jgi:hypothetical protein
LVLILRVKQSVTVSEINGPRKIFARTEELITKQKKIKDVSSSVLFAVSTLRITPWAWSETYIW